MQLQIVKDGPLWIALLPTRFGSVEFLCGEGDEPDLQNLMLAERFLVNPEYLDEIRRNCLRPAFLWRPVRLAINNKGRLGVQFRNRLTGKQVGMFLADEHSQFRETRDNIEVSDEDRNRLRPSQPGGSC